MLPLLQNGEVIRKYYNKKETFLFKCNDMICEKIPGSKYTDRYYFSEEDFELDIFDVINKDWVKTIEGFEFYG
jgi:hypothetical protein